MYLKSHLHQLLLTEFGITDIQASKAALSTPDTLTYDQVLSDPDIEERKISAHKEITRLQSKEMSIEVLTTEATSKILPGTWVFHCKRAPTGIITKLKTRYCVRGDLQEDTPKTYAPVVSWSKIRLVLVFTLTQNWHLTCVDFNNTFVQADLPGSSLDTSSRRIQIQDNSTYLSKTQERSLHCAQALVSVSKKRID